MRHRHYIGTICKKRDRSGEKVMRINEKERKCGKEPEKGTSCVEEIAEKELCG